MATAIPEQYQHIVKRATIAAGAVGVPGAFSFGADVTAMTAIWTTMIVAIARASGHAVDTIFATKLAAAVLTAGGAYVGGSKIALSLLPMVPLLGGLTAVGVNTSLNALFTYRLGIALSKLFDKCNIDHEDIVTTAGTAFALFAGLPTFGEVGGLLRLLKSDGPTDDPGAAIAS